MGDGEGGGLPYGKTEAAKLFLVHARAQDQPVRRLNLQSVGAPEKIDVAGSTGDSNTLWGTVARAIQPCYQGGANLVCFSHRLRSVT